MSVVDAYKISESIRARLKVLDPALSTDLGSPVRKIIDAVSEAISDYAFDTALESHRFNIDAYSGTDLDEFVALFGFQRQRARSATGVLRISRDSADAALLISPNTQFYRPAIGIESPIYFALTGIAYMEEGVTSIEVPVRAVMPGSAGNVPAGTIVGIDSSLSGLRVTNPQPTSGGLDDETDEHLRQRFRDTVLRNIAGTKDQYIALARSYASVTSVQVVGQASSWTEIVTFETDNGVVKATSTNPEVAELVPNQAWVFDIDGIDHDGMPDYYVAGIDFSVALDGGKVVFSAIDGGISDGAVCRIEYAYRSIYSRGYTDDNPNAVDVVIVGESPESITVESVLTKDAVFVDTGGDLDVSNWRRLDGSQPTPGNVFVALPFQPVLTLPDVIEFGSGVNVDEGAGYYLVRDITAWGGSQFGRDGIEFVVGANAPNGIDDIPDGTHFWLTAVRDVAPAAVADLIEPYRQVGADVLVRAARKRLIGLTLVIMYSVFPRQTVDAQIEDAIESLFSRIKPGSWLQISDIEDVVHDVPGVDAVRFQSMDVYAEDGTTMLQSGITDDLYISTIEYPVLHALTVINRTQDRW